MRCLVIGRGEIGQAVHRVFGKVHEVSTYDITDSQLPGGTYDLLLICFPYSEMFAGEVMHYYSRFNAKAVIVFSTVAIGTTSQIPSAVHSPVEGKHPELAKSIRLMPRWVGGYNELAHQFFTEAGFKPHYCDRPEHTEFLKLSSTSLYGLNIELARYRKSVCDELGMDFENVKQFDKDYNMLYKQLDLPQFCRYILDPPEGNLGGHCIRPNAEVLDTQYPSVLLKEIYSEKEGEEC